MPDLKAVKEVVLRVSSNDLDDFIREAFNLPRCARKGVTYPYEFVATEEADNYSSYRYDVKEESLSKSNWQKLKNMQAGNFEHFVTGPLLNEACHLGYINPGTYFIEVFW